MSVLFDGITLTAGFRNGVVKRWTSNNNDWLEVSTIQAFQSAEGFLFSQGKVLFIYFVYFSMKYHYSFFKTIAWDDDVQVWDDSKCAKLFSLNGHIRKVLFCCFVLLSIFFLSFFLSFPNRLLMWKLGLINFLLLLLWIKQSGFI